MELLEGRTVRDRLKSELIPQQEVVDYARSVEATVYCVGFRGESGLLARSPRAFLRHIAQETAMYTNTLL